MDVSVQRFSVLAPDIAAAIQLGSLLSQAGCDVTLEPQASGCYRIFGTTETGQDLVASLVIGWVEREQIGCVELVFDNKAQQLSQALLASLAPAA